MIPRPCSPAPNMPRFGANKVLSEKQITDLVAFPAGSGIAGQQVSAERLWKSFLCWTRPFAWYKVDMSVKLFSDPILTGPGSANSQPFLASAVAQASELVMFEQGGCGLLRALGTATLRRFYDKTNRSQGAAAAVASISASRVMPASPSPRRFRYTPHFRGGGQRQRDRTHHPAISATTVFWGLLDLRSPAKLENAARNPKAGPP